jgi:colanic acid biosynthesis glycosyl transferase WcaI
MRDNVLILNHVFWPDNINTARHISELAEELSNRGLNVSVLVGNRDYRSNLKYVAKENWNKVIIHRIYIPILFGYSWAQRIFTSFWLIFSFAFRLAFGHNYKYIIIGSNPPFIFLIIPWLRFIFRKSKLFIWSFDLYPEAILAELNINNIFISKVANHVAKFCYSKLDAVIDIGPCMKERMIKYSSKLKFHTLTPWSFVENNNIDYVHIQTRKKLFNDARLTILYTGTVGNAHEFNHFLTLARKCKQINGDIGFCFAGFGSRYNELKSLINKEDTNITLADFVNSDIELEQRISAADLMMVSLKPEWTGISVPSKFFTCIATGKPVLYSGSEDSAISNWIKSFNLGFQITELNIDYVAYQLSEIALNKLLILELKKRSLKIYNDKFSKKVICDQWFQILLSNN